MQNNSVILIRLIFFSYPFLLIFDSLNGYMIRNYNLSINIFLKFIWLLLVIFVIFRIGSLISRIMVTFVFSIIFLILFFHASLNLNYNIEDLLADINFQIKTLVPLFIFLFFSNILKNYPSIISEKKIIYIFTISWSIIVINIILGFIGIGYSPYVIYGNKVGGIGFFKSGNELSGLFILTVAVIQNYLVNIRKQFFLYLFFSLLSLSISILTGSKASILGIILLTFIIPFLKRRTFVKKLKLFSFSLLVVPVVILIFINLFSFIEPRLEKLRYFYETYGILFMITTGRSYFAEIAFNIFHSTYSFIDLIFGIGYNRYIELFGKYYETEKIAEIDLIDIFMTNGIIFLFYILGIWIFFVSRAWKRRKQNIWYRFLVFINILMLLMSIVPGHILWSGMLGPFIGIIQIIGNIHSKGGNLENPTNKQFSLFKRRI